MELEFSMTSGDAKAAALAALARHEHHATTGSVRLAHPFTVRVGLTAEAHVDQVRRIVLDADPGASVITEGDALATS